MGGKSARDFENLRDHDVTFSDNSPTIKTEKIPIVKPSKFRYFPRIMDLAENALRNAVAAGLEGLATNPFAFEKQHRLPEDTVRSILQGTKKLGTTLNKAQAVCEALGLEFYIGPHREAGPITQVAVEGADYAHIPLHDALLAAGDGHQNHVEEVIDHLAFRRDWLKRIGITASAARLARVQGESMQPTLWAGDMILIDTSRDDPPIRRRDAQDQRRSSVYAMIEDGQARVKRIERPTADTMFLISDNPDYPPELRQAKRPDDFRIIGKVVWWGHTERG